MNNPQGGGVVVVVLGSTILMCTIAMVYLIDALARLIIHLV